jgi:hypothetical protein
VQELPSSAHGTKGVDTQVWFASSQVARQSVDAAHGSPACTSQLPDRQLSGPSQNAPSSHGDPSDTNWPMQLPTLSQWSFVVQSLPSKHVAPCPTN